MSSPQSSFHRIRLRRLIFSGFVFSTLGILSWRVFIFLSLNGISLLELVLFALFIVLMLPIIISFWTAVFGFIFKLRGGDTLEISRSADTDVSPEDLPLTAIAMPVYNEDPARVMAGLKATYQSLQSIGMLSRFEFFILSDTTDPDVWVREELAFVDVRHEVAEPERIFYRNRRQNTEKKTGNIADFCAGWGDRYKYMIVFDADSIMTGSSLVKLVGLMEKHPQIGIIQAPPLPVNRSSLFGRVQQFAMNAYSVLFLSGLNFWQGGAGNYWGHNAIIRIRPFVEHCRLPILPGKPPLGGAILSHDFIEAAFMRRAGWRVHLGSELGGSYEEMPATLLGYAARDRRWCQGNLQHGKLLFTSGLHFISRVHIWLGIMGYLASPLWLLMLVLTTIEGIRQTTASHAYFGKAASLFPNWPVDSVRSAVVLFVATMALLLLPKCLSLLWHWSRAKNRAMFGGSLKLVLSVVLEILLSTLLAPNLALLQSRFVAEILMGSIAKWEAQDRGESGTSWREALQRHWSATVLGILWAGLLAFTAPKLLAWFSPVLLGFILAIPLSVWTSKANLGRWARRVGLFLIPEETNPPQIIHDFETALHQNEARPWAELGDPLARVLSDPEVRELHLAILSQAPQSEDVLENHQRQGIVLKYLHHGPQALTVQEKRQLLLHADAIEALGAPIRAVQSAC